MREELQRNEAEVDSNVIEEIQNQTAQRGLKAVGSIKFR